MVLTSSPGVSLVIPDVDSRTPPAGPGSLVSPALSSTGSRSDRQAFKRRLASQWIAQVVGVNVPHRSDQEFRGALVDGVVLCHLVNSVKPGAIARVVEDGGPDGAAVPANGSVAAGEVIQAFENVSNYIKAAKSLGCETFSACDLEATADERPSVMESVLSLRDVSVGRTPRPAAAGTPPQSLFAALPSPRVGSARGVAGTPPFPPAPRPALSPGFSFTPAAAQLVAKHGVGPAVAEGPDGLNHLMRSCTHMLRSRMGLGGGSTPEGGGPPPPTPASAAAEAPLAPAALDAVGPVLESVLSNLTSEYEKRLLSKDQEFKLAQEAQDRMRRQISKLQGELESWRHQASSLREEVRSGSAPAAPASGAAALSEAERGRVVAEAEAAWASRSSELEEAAERAAAGAAAARAALTEAERSAAEAGERAATEREARERTAAELEALRERFAAVSAHNRTLYNAVQDAKGALRVFCRVRPSGATGDESREVVEACGADGTGVRLWSDKRNRWHEFRFDAVFGPESSQEAVYVETAPLVRSVLDGYNVCIFAYGQTGSGKTHTISGSGDPLADPAGRGINYRTLDDLFALRDDRAAEVEYRFEAQLLEIYNEQVRDLLAPAGGPGSGASLAISSQAPSGLNVPEARRVPVNGTEDVLEVLALGARNRAVAETRMNARSSRSHLVLTVVANGIANVPGAERGDPAGSASRTRACLHLVDLAGSERVGRSGAEGQQLLEAQHINRSLSALGNVMAALASKAAHVPFRDSKLTALLQDSLSGGAKALMFVHVAPEASSASETLSTLNFGKGVAEITLGAAKKNYVASAGPAADAGRPGAEDALAKLREELRAERERAAALERRVDELRGRVGKGAAVERLPSDGETIQALHGSPGGGAISVKVPALRLQAAADVQRPGVAGGTPTSVSRLALGRLADTRSTAGAASSPGMRSRIPPGSSPATARSARGSPAVSSIPRPMSARPSTESASRRASGGSEPGVSGVKASGASLTSVASAASRISGMSRSASAVTAGRRWA